MLVNVTIDDASETGAQFTYLPPGGWSFGPTCHICAATPHVDVGATRNGTWHDGSYNDDVIITTEVLRLASVPFYGTAIYVYAILSNTESDPDGYSNVTFLIDSHPAGDFVHIPKGGDLYNYNVPVFVNDSIPNGDHTLTIQNGHVGGPRSLFLLDYVVYSYDKGGNGGPPFISKNLFDKSNSGRIVGGVLGTLSVLLLGLLGLLWYRQRSYKASASSTDDVSGRPPFGHRVISWFRKGRQNLKSYTRSSFTFNSGLLVRPMRNRNQTLVSHVPPTVPTTAAIHPRYPLPSAPNSLHYLQPNREPMPSTSDPLGRREPHIERLQPASITEWRQRTYLEADTVPPRFVIPEVDLSSYYEFSSVASQPAPRRSRPGTRRFTVMNN